MQQSTLLPFLTSNQDRTKVIDRFWSRIRTRTSCFQGSSPSFCLTNYSILISITTMSPSIMDDNLMEAASVVQFQLPSACSYTLIS
ncbi:hypothetical protein I79_018738 [Cricetulus griseus]|uniref:Uncharacterized protein n=1 Tax=Cricetulus griseus TaxID=10029 RepID=G3I5I9_CRIGR|nr:hypothetical protein I79_018738 [Cricetulus griseus]